MPSDVDVCNLALANLGDSANIACINPPEGSAQAAHCARFYPIAREALLEMHDWNFATRRIALSLLSATIAPWQYCYAKPNLIKKVISVIPPSADDDYTSPSVSTYNEDDVVTTAVPQPYALETLSDGTEVICTNQEDAVLRYTVSVTDPTKFSSLFVLALGWLLASMLAGPILKGKEGRAMAAQCLQELKFVLPAAKTADTDQRSVQVTHSVPWLAGR